MLLAGTDRLDKVSRRSVGKSGGGVRRGGVSRRGGIIGKGGCGVAPLRWALIGRVLFSRVRGIDKVVLIRRMQCRGDTPGEGGGVYLICCA